MPFLPLALLAPALHPGLPTGLPPVPPPPPGPLATVVRPYDAPDEDWGTGHRGIDLSASGDRPVRSLSPGTVAFVGTVAGVPIVTVRLGDGRRVTYQPVRATVAPGLAVDRGTPLGTLATGGHCGRDRACLHVGLRDDVGYWDPTWLVGGQRRPAVLKPA